MKRLPKLLSAFLAFAVFVTCLGCGGAKHEHTYTEVAAVEATCDTSGNVLYYKCDCGDVFVKNGDEYVKTDLASVTISPFGHAFTKRVKEIEATCTSNGVKAHAYCGDCGKWFEKKGDDYVETTEENLVIPMSPHVFSHKVIADEYRIAEATDTAPQKFAMSCVCGKADDAHEKTFTVGKTLAEYAEDYEEDETPYEPHALVASIYDTSKNVYGFTWNADKVTSRPVVEIRKAGSGDEFRVIGASSEEMPSYEKVNGEESDTSGNEITVNYVRANVKLDANTEYEYRVGDKYVDSYTEILTLKTVNPTETSTWKFAHVSDSQTLSDSSRNEVGSETYFAKTLKGITSDPLNRFVVHTGDVVEWSKYESYWRAMIDGNASYFAGIPTMAVAGNHDTTYRSGNNRYGSHETYKHFNYSMPEQYTGLGFYYSYSYGGVKFIMVNTNDLYGSELKDAQMKWLENELKTKTEKWTIVALHNPMYSPGKWGSDPQRNGIALRLMSQLSDLFARYGVDLVLQGHDHVVSKTFPIGANKKTASETFETIDGVKYSVNPQGVIYVMNGPAGNQARTDVYSNDETLYEYAEGSQKCSWAEFEVSGDKITVYVKNASSGSVVTQKTWGIKKAA